MSQEVSLRAYRAEDLDSMYALDVVCFEAAFRFSRRAMRRFAEARGAIALIAETGEGMAGFGIVQVEGGVGYLVTLDVAPALRRRGVAGRLMEALEAGARGAGAAGMELHVFAGNAAAVRFYERAGYRRVGAEPGFYGRGLDAWVYAKTLG